jgi:hypothetical protein
MYYAQIRNILELKPGSSIRNFADTMSYSLSTVFYVLIYILEFQFWNWLPIHDLLRTEQKMQFVQFVNVLATSPRKVMHWS